MICTVYHQYKNRRSCNSDQHLQYTVYAQVSQISHIVEEPKYVTGFHLKALSEMMRAHRLLQIFRAVFEHV